MRIHATEDQVVEPNGMDGVLTESVDMDFESPMLSVLMGMNDDFVIVDGNGRILVDRMISDDELHAGVRYIRNVLAKTRDWVDGQ